jgi:peptidoglycan/LPS O-acetylase OafA/YrhL
VKAKPPYLPALDGIRAYAILAIVLLHVLGVARVLPGSHGRGFEIVAWGTVGNALAAFFIISGFVLMLGVLARGGDPGPLRRFYARRAVRIYPAYWLVLLIALPLSAVALSRVVAPIQPTISSPIEVVVQFLGLPMPARMFDASMPVVFWVDPVLWFVSVIVGFYLVFPLIARWYARHPWIGAVAAAVITLAWVWAASHLNGVFREIEGGHAAGWVVKLIAVEQLPGWAFSFGIGMTAASAYTRLTKAYPAERLARAAIRLAPLALAALALSVYLFGHDAADNDIKSLAPTIVRTSPLIPVLYSLSLAFAMSVILLGPQAVQRPFTNAPIRRLGELSYGIFLIHYIVAVYVGVVVLGIPADGSWGSAAALFAVALAGSALFAYLSLRFVERPARAWVARRLATDRAAQAVPEEAPAARPVPAAPLRSPP